MLLNLILVFENVGVLKIRYVYGFYQTNKKGSRQVSGFLNTMFIWKQYILFYDKNRSICKASNLNVP